MGVEGDSNDQGCRPAVGRPLAGLRAAVGQLKLLAGRWPAVGRPSAGLRAAVGRPLAGRVREFSRFNRSPRNRGQFYSIYPRNTPNSEF